MNHTCTRLREVVTSVLNLKLDGPPITTTTINDDRAEFSKSRCNVDGHDWEIRFHPSLYTNGDSYRPGHDLVFLGESRAGVTAILSAKITNHSGHGDDFVAYNDRKTVLRVFHQPLDRSLPIYIGVGIAYKAGVAADHPKRCSLTVECTITVFKDPASAEGASNLSQNLGELLRSEAAADVTFSVSGENFAAHRSVLAARSPVFMAEFFGEKKESIKFQVVEIQDMDAEVFKAMLQFIYTDVVPELDEKEPVEAATMSLARRLVVAAERYGLHRLIVMCKRRLATGMDAGTVASTLLLAEKLNFYLLKAKCIEFIVGGSPENLDAVLATEGHKHLAASSPSLLTEILKAAHGKKSACPSSCKTIVNNGSSAQHEFTSIEAATLRSMKHTCTQLNEGVQSVHLLKIDGFSVTKDTIGNNTSCLKSRCTVDGHDMEIRFYPAHRHHQHVYIVALELAYFGGECTHGLEVTLSGRIVRYQNSGVEPKEFKPVSKTFTHPSDCTLPVYIGKGKVRDSLPSPAASMTVECAITVFRDLNAIRLPASELHQHLYELLHIRAGADVTFNVSGESFTAYKNILAARSPVFKAEFFGEMEEKTSGFVEIKDMDAQVFKAMLRFIYTDMVPVEFDSKPEAVEGTVMAQHLMVAADRYGLDRLKVMSEERLSHGIDIGTVASTLALAEQFNCPYLKAKCIQFISEGSSTNLDAVLATEGYRQLVMSSPSVLTELLKAAHRNKRRRVTDS